MVKEDGQAKGLANQTYVKWILEAIQKVKSQKQRPNEERIVAAVLFSQSKASKKSILDQLEYAVKDGAVLKILNKGLCSYQDPARVTKLQTRTVVVRKTTDLTRVVTRCIKDLGEDSGSTLPSILKYLSQSYVVKIEDGSGSDLAHCVRMSLKHAVTSGRATQDGKRYKAVVGKSEASYSKTNGVVDLAAAKRKV